MDNLRPLKGLFPLCFYFRNYKEFSKRTDISLLLFLTITLVAMGMFDFFKSKSNGGAKFVSEQRFKTNTENQMKMSPQTLIQLRQIGVTAQRELKLEYFFYTNSIEKANAFANELSGLKYTVRSGKGSGPKHEFVITGWTTSMKMDDATVGNWTKVMCELGYKFDCDFDGWGTSPDMPPNK